LSVEQKALKRNKIYGVILHCSLLEAVAPFLNDWDCLALTTMYFQWRFFFFFFNPEFYSFAPLHPNFLLMDAKACDNSGKGAAKYHRWLIHL